jgi:type IV secretory pathway VirB10-like protein
MLFHATLVRPMTFLSSLSRIFVALAALACATVACAEVYTWKDASGRVHYSDQPPPGGEAKPTKAAPAPKYAPAVAEPAAAQSGAAAQSDPKPDSKVATTQSGPKTWQEKDLEAKQKRAADQEAEAKRKQEADRADEKKRYCDGLRSNLSMLEKGGRVTTTNAAGERVYLDDSQLKQEAERTRGQLSRDCK